MCMFQLTDKQYTWTALNANARLRRWGEIERLFQTKVNNPYSGYCTVNCALCHASLVLSG